MRHGVRQVTSNLSQKDTSRSKMVTHDLELSHRDLPPTLNHIITFLQGDDMHVQSCCGFC
eukprot:1157813-Pelagomonas_calceolata.AAC.6